MLRIWRKCSIIPHQFSHTTFSIQIAGIVLEKSDCVESCLIEL